ncbi:hypothetical protein P691DRAFT_613280, partial [Macrolepiota fuliginosa MF-IS2]
DLFPKTLPHVNTLPEDIHHHILVTAAEKICVTHEYSCPCKWWEAWKKLIEEHLKAGHIHPSSSPFASPSFLIAKFDPNAAPHWVTDYCCPNAFTILDRFPLPCIDNILSDYTKGKI